MVGTSWREVASPEVSGFMKTFSRSIAQAERAGTIHLPSLGGAPALLMASDSSGSHRPSSHFVHAFLIADPRTMFTWEDGRSQVRGRCLHDGRRVSYKSLNDRQQRAALPGLLGAAATIPGVLVVVAIDRRVVSIFEKPVQDREPDFARWKPKTLEKALVLIHLASLFLAGLSAAGQDVLWFHDEDDFVADDERLRDFVKAFAWVSSHYLPHMLRHLRIGTTRSDTGHRGIEDLVAIPDLVAGAWSALLDAYREEGIALSRAIAPEPRRLPAKAQRVLGWFSGGGDLCRVAFEICTPAVGNGLTVRRLKLHSIGGIRVVPAWCPLGRSRGSG